MLSYPSIGDAIANLRPNIAFEISNEDYSSLIWTNKEIHPPSFEEVQIEYKKLIDKYNSYNYFRKRKAEYPSFSEQLDLLYHEGYDGWKSKIDIIKNKYPKKGTI